MHDRVHLWSGFYETTWADYGQYGESSRESLRQAPRRIPDAHLHRRARTGRAKCSSRRRRSERLAFRSWPRQTAGRGLDSLSQSGDAVDPLLWRPWSPVGCAVQSHPQAEPRLALGFEFESGDRTSSPLSLTS